MKISVAELKRRLPVGTKFTAEFIGKNARICRPGMQVTTRVVVKQTGQMESRFLDGPSKDSTIYLTWSHIEVDERDGSVYLKRTEEVQPEEFLKITIINNSDCKDLMPSDDDEPETFPPNAGTTEPGERKQIPVSKMKLK